MKPRADKVLVIKLRAIGDVVLSTAVLPNIRKAYPSAAVHFLTEKASAPVLEHHPDVDRVLVLPGRGRGIAGAAAFYRGFLRERYDLVFDLFGNPRSAFLTLLSGAPARVGFSFRGRSIAYNIRVEPRGDRVHEVEFNLDALRAVDIPVLVSQPRMPVTDRGLAAMDAWLGASGIRGDFCVGMHVWGSWPAKRWDIGRFAELADLLVRKHKAAVIWTWGPGEEAHARAAQAAAACPTHLAPPTSLHELAALFSRCSLVIANDSGPMHVAAALGVPTVGIFGPTNRFLQGPFGNGHAAVCKEGLDCLGCNKLTCSHLSCMKTLTAAEVFAGVEKVLSRASSGSGI